ncbi:hypothetical protein FQN54_009013 [Arachnomyces sp. PD_36]|nr:hypothetical protein FQN54_009013 [Arachnomyces sp. PD_36]
MPFTEVSSVPGNEPAPGSKSDPKTADFSGDVAVSDEVPSKEMIEKAADITIVDTDGKEMPFKSLYTPSGESGDQGEKRTLVIFIRHFFCGSCQDYIRFLVQAIPPSSLPPSTSLVIVGCGTHTLIKMYADETSCPYPIYANPSRSLYDIFGMLKTMSLGTQPEYIKGSLPSYIARGIMQAFRRIGAGDVLKGGDSRQVGGEFLFTAGGAGEETSNPEAKVTWCHRMKNTRDHSSLAEIKGQLGISAESEGEKAKPST